MAYGFANAYTTTLSGAITSGATSLTVSSDLPTALVVPFMCRIDTEYLKVTAVSGTGNRIWTVERAAEESTRFPAASHSDGASVNHVLTGATLRQIKQSTANVWGVGHLPVWAINSISVDLVVANRAMLWPFTVDTEVTVSQVKYRVQTQSGNIDFGLYDDSLSRLTSTGSIVCPAAGAASSSLTTSVTLKPNELYYAGFAQDNTAVRIYGWLPPSGYSSGDFIGTSVFRRGESSMPLPSTFTVAGENDAHRIVAFWFA